MKMIQQKIYARARNDQDVIRTMMNAFRQFDVNAKGVIGPNDLRRIIKHFYDLDLSEMQTTALFDAVDTDGDGFIDQQEFIHAFAHRLNEKSKQMKAKPPRNKDDPTHPKKIAAPDGQQLWSDVKGNKGLEEIIATIRGKILARARNDADIQRGMINAFRQFHAEGGGLSKAKLHLIIKNFFGLDINDIMLDALFKLMDRDNNGFVSQQEFVRTFAHNDELSPYEQAVAARRHRRNSEQMYKIDRHQQAAPVGRGGRPNELSGGRGARNLNNKELPHLELNDILNMITTKIYARARNDTDVKRTVFNAFRKFDTNENNGNMDKQKLHDTVRAFFDLTLTDRQLTDLFHYIDKNNDNNIDFEEFVHAFVKKEHYNIIDDKKQNNPFNVAPPKISERAHKQAAPNLIAFQQPGQRPIQHAQEAPPRQPAPPTSSRPSDHGNRRNQQWEKRRQERMQQQPGGQQQQQQPQPQPPQGYQPRNPRPPQHPSGGQWQQEQPPSSQHEQGQQRFQLDHPDAGTRGGAPPQHRQYQQQHPPPSQQSQQYQKPGQGYPGQDHRVSPRLGAAARGMFGGQQPFQQQGQPMGQPYTPNSEAGYPPQGYQQQQQFPPQYQQQPPQQQHPPQQQFQPY
jgi:Ca2+-binding EF-hand superfamily protein